DHLEPRARNLLRHVLARRQERRVLVADDDQGRHADRRQTVDHTRVLLREHSARGVGEALSALVVAERVADLAAPAAERLEPTRLQGAGALVGALVPRVASL